MSFLSSWNDKIIEVKNRLMVAKDRDWNVGHSVVSCLLRPHELSMLLWSQILQGRMMGYPFLLQGIFPTQVSNLGHLHCRWFFTVLVTRVRVYKG